MLISWKFVVFSFLYLSTECHAYKILAFLPFPSNSHHNIFLSLIKVLADRGHEITYYTPVKPKLTHPNIKLKLTQSYNLEKLLKMMDLSQIRRMSVAGVAHGISWRSEVMSEDYYGNKIAQEIIHSSEKYDAVLMESFFSQEPVSALIHKFGCVGIEVSTLGDMAWIAEFSGVPFNAAYQVDFQSELSQDMTIWQKLHNVYAIASIFLVNYYHLYRKQSIMDKYFNYTGWETRPPLQQLLANRSLFLLNSDPVLSYPYPSAPHVKNIAGLNLLPNQPLPKDLETFMNESEHGVIYFSFGTNVNTSEMMKGPAGKAFMKVFESLPQRVLMKWESDHHEIEIPANVKTSKWFPQRDILAHKNCKLFITHGGFLSLTETVYYGVPIVGTPFFTDQFKNMLHVQTMGYGLTLKYENITEESVSWALNETINNPKYKEVVMKMSQMFRDRRHTAHEEAIYWVEHAIKYPNALTPRSAFMSFWEKRIFEVGTFSLLSLILIFILFRILVAIIRKSGNKTSKKIKQS